MIESNDAIKVVETISSNLISIANNKQNFAKLPDIFWGCFARGLQEAMIAKIENLV
jgi:hypothetical protein